MRHSFASLLLHEGRSVKVGGRPGIPLRVRLTPSELGINDTNKLWHERSSIEHTAETTTGVGDVS